jgi:hypothetical protein
MKPPEKRVLRKGLDIFAWLILGWRFWLAACYGQSGLRAAWL